MNIKILLQNRSIATLLILSVTVSTVVKGNILADSLQVSATDTVSTEMSKFEENDKSDTTKIRIGKKNFTIIEDDGKSTEILIGEKSITIAAEGKDTTIIDEEGIHKKGEEKKRKHNFDAHWGGIDIGLNNFFDENMSLSRNGSNQYMDLNASKSWAVNLNFGSVELPITSHVAVVSGLGFNFNHYNFEDDLTLIVDSNHTIQPQYLPEDLAVKKSKMNTIYLSVPLLVECQFGKKKSKERPYIAIGAVGGIKLSSRTKVVAIRNGEKEKDVEKGDFNINTVRYGLTARAGTDDIGIYANYYLSSLFEKNKGPELYPFDVGLSFTF